MIAMLKRKSVIIGLIVLSVLAVAVPLVAVSAAGAPPVPAVRPGADVMRVQGTIVSITASQIEIAPSNGSVNVKLTINKDTNFNIHGVDWLNPGGLAGKTVNAVYKPVQSGTPIAIQIAINMPKPTVPAVKNLPKGTITSLSDTSMTVTLDAVAPAALKAGQTVAIVPAPPATPPATLQATPNKAALVRVQGTVDKVESAVVSIKLTNGKGSLAVSQSVVVVPVPVPGPGKVITRVQGTVTTVTGTPSASVTINLTSGADLLKVGELVAIIPTPVASAPNVKSNVVQGKVATIADSIVTITLANGAGSLIANQTVDIVPRPAPGMMKPGVPGPGAKPGVMPGLPGMKPGVNPGGPFKGAPPVRSGV